MTATSSATPTLLLVDGSSFLFRAYHAVQANLTSPSGLPTNAIYGVANMLRKLLDDYHSAYCAVIFDAPGRNFRHELYPDYKAHRPPIPDELRVQIEPLHALIRAMGWPLLIVPGVEADDVIGTLTRRAETQGFRVVIASGDKDLAQLVSARVMLDNTMSNSKLDVAGVKQKFGVLPEQIVDYLSLIGDSVDNIPGVPKVGPKTAARWLADYGTLEQLLAHADSISGKIGENLRASREQLPLTKRLVTLDCTVPLDLEPTDLRKAPPDPDVLREQLHHLGFTSWLKQLDGFSPTFPPKNPQNAASVSAIPIATTPPAIEGEYVCIRDWAQFETWLKRLASVPCFSLDTETTSLDYTQARLIGLSFAIAAGEAAYIPLCHEYPGVPTQLPREEVLARLKPLLEDSTRGKLGQNLKYDAHVLANHGIALRGIIHDTLLESYVLDSTARHDLDSLAKQHLHYDTLHYEDVTGKGAKQIPFAEVPVENATRYAAEDADIALRLHEVLWPQLCAQPALATLYQTVEIPLLPVLLRMERHGVLIDAQRLAEQSHRLAEQMLVLEQQAHDLAGQVFNLGSPKQIQHILYDQLHLPVLKKTPTGQPSTDESVLQELAEDYALPRVLLEYRGLSKLKSTYTDKLPQQINPETGRVHTSYHQAVTATGRLSSSDPNLQNIPIRSEAGREIRRAFIAPPGHVLVAADYSQIELRIMAHLSQDPGLLAAFASAQDIHRATAAEVFGVAPEHVTPELRRSAKAINFGLIYGMSAFGLSKQLGLPRTEAQDYIERYFARYPGVKRYMERIRGQAQERGYVETVFGRRLYIPDIRSKNSARRQYAERTAINVPMQGSAADIIKRAMIALDHWLENERPGVRMMLQVHDELVFEIETSAVAMAMVKIRELMTQAAQLAVPLVVDIGVGENWDQAH